jgi:hypothetical protein
MGTVVITDYLLCPCIWTDLDPQGSNTNLGICDTLEYFGGQGICISHKKKGIRNIMAHSERSNACERYATKKGLGWEQWRSLEVAHSSDAIPNGSNPFTKMLRCKRTTCATCCLAVVSRTPKWIFRTEPQSIENPWRRTILWWMEGATQKTRNKHQ